MGSLSEGAIVTKSYAWRQMLLDPLCCHSGCLKRTFFARGLTLAQPPATMPLTSTGCSERLYYFMVAPSHGSIV